MTELSRLNPTGRFTGLAELYARHRPDYPAAAIDCITSRGQLGPRSLLVDVGAGTGISARLLAQRGIPVVAIEPNAEMRQRAQAEPLPAGLPVPIYQEGLAEATGLASGTADVVLAAQAFHWFEPDAALREFHRILRPGGWLAVLGNERDDTDPFTAAFGAVLATAPETATVERPRARAGEVLLGHPLFTDTERLTFAHEQRLDEEGVLGRAFSASYAPREPEAMDAMMQALRDVFHRFEQAGTVCLRYRTTLLLGRRRD